MYEFLIIIKTTKSVLIDAYLITLLIKMISKAKNKCFIVNRFVVNFLKTVFF